MLCFLDAVSRKYDQKVICKIICILLVNMSVPITKTIIVFSIVSLRILNTILHAWTHPTHYEYMLVNSLGKRKFWLLINYFHKLLRVNGTILLVSLDALETIKYPNNIILCCTHIKQDMCKGELISSRDLFQPNLAVVKKVCATNQCTIKLWK